MLSYLARRVAGLIAVLLTMSFIVFCLQSIVPADPARALAGPGAPMATIESLRQQLGLEDPIPVQYGRFLEHIVQGDLGVSVRTRQPVTEDVLKYLPASLELCLVAMLLGLALTLLLALGQNTSRGYSIARLLILCAGSAPIFLTGLLLVYVFWFQFDLLPGAGRLAARRFSGPTGLNVLDGLLTGRPDIRLDALAHLLLPALTLSLPLAVAVGRSLGGSLHEVMQQPYIRTMRGKGQSRIGVLLNHGLRNALPAPLSMLGLQVGLLLGNLLIVERIFSWPGLGLYLVQAFGSSDLPAILGVSMTFGTLYILANILVELARTAADPRIVLSRSPGGRAG